MDDISYLILEKGFRDAYYNMASLINLRPQDEDFVGVSEQDLHKTFASLIEQNILAQHPISGNGISRNYLLTDKGKKAYFREQKKRSEAYKERELQRILNESVLKTNDSMIETNQSVKKTNQSVQDTNLALTTNIKTQNKQAKASIYVSISAVVVAIVSLIIGLTDNSSSKYLHEVQSTNQILHKQIEVLNDALKHQIKTDSALINNVKPAKNNRN